MAGERRREGGDVGTLLQLCNLCSALLADKDGAWRGHIDLRLHLRRFSRSQANAPALLRAGKRG